MQYFHVDSNSSHFQWEKIGFIIKNFNTFYVTLLLHLAIHYFDKLITDSKIKACNIVFTDYNLLLVIIRSTKTKTFISFRE